MSSPCDGCRSLCCPTTLQSPPANQRGAPRPAGHPGPPPWGPPEGPLDRSYMLTARESASFPKLTSPSQYPAVSSCCFSFLVCHATPSFPIPSVVKAFSSIHKPILQPLPSESVFLQIFTAECCVFLPSHFLCFLLLGIIVDLYVLLHTHTPHPCWRWPHSLEKAAASGSNSSLHGCGQLPIHPGFSSDL